MLDLVAHPHSSIPYVHTGPILHQWTLVLRSLHERAVPRTERREVLDRLNIFRGVGIRKTAISDYKLRTPYTTQNLQRKRRTDIKIYDNICLNSS